MVCVNHPHTDATLVCTRCGRWLCEACARTVSDGIRQLRVRSCSFCQGVLRAGALPKEPETLTQLLSRPLNLEGALTVGALSLPGLGVGLGGLLGLIFGFIYLAVLAGYYYQLIDHVGRQSEGLPFSSEVLGWGDMSGKLLRGLGSLAVGAGPALLWSHFIGEPWFVALGLLIVGLLLLPASILAGVLTRSGINVIYPPAWLEIIARTPRSYGRLLGRFWASVVIWAGGLWLLALVLGPVPFLLWLVLPLANTFLALSQAALLGGFLQREADALGYQY